MKKKHYVMNEKIIRQLIEVKLFVALVTAMIIFVGFCMLVTPVHASVDVHFTRPDFDPYGTYMGFQGHWVWNGLSGLPNTSANLTQMVGLIPVSHNCSGDMQTGTFYDNGAYGNVNITGDYIFDFTEVGQGYEVPAGDFYYMLTFNPPVPSEALYHMALAFDPILDCGVYGNSSNEGQGYPLGQDYFAPYFIYSSSPLIEGYPPGEFIVTWGELVPPPVCSFSATPTSGASPLTIAFADASSNTPTSWDWTIQNNGTPIIESLHSTLQASTGILHNQANYDINFSASNDAGSCNLFSPNYFTITTPSTITVEVAAYDAISHSAISGATVGIQNVTSNAWTNATAPTGTYTFTSSDGASAIPLSIGQTLYAGATATGYSENGHAFSIPYSGYSTSIALMPVTAVNATGTFWLTVTVVKNEDGLPLNSAVVQVLSGGNNYQQYTGSSGMTTFQNITSGYTFSVTAFAQAYAAQTKVLPKDADFMNTSFSLVRMGATPVTTPVSPATTSTTAPVVSWTETGGQPVSEQEGSALDAIAQIAAALGGWVKIAIYAISIWLLWILVYEITGGKVIDKIMRRGRGGRRH